MYRLGYNTNGMPHHRVVDALQVLAELGYGGVALTPDAGLLDPYELDAAELVRVRDTACDLGLLLNVETGSRFLLDPRRKHFPTLLEESAADRARRVDFLERCVRLASDLGAESVSFWAGRAPDGSVGDPRGSTGEASEAHWERLCAGVEEVLRCAKEHGVGLAFEPEPGMFLERPGGYGELLRRLGVEPSDLGLCLDVGHLLCTGDLPVTDVIHEWGSALTTVHLDDIKNGEHVHRMFGRGDLDLAGTLRALREVGFEGLAAVELSRDGHRGVQAAQEAMQHLRAALGSQ